MAKNIVVFQHNPWEGPGTHLINAFARHDLKMTIVNVWQEDIPEVNSFDALIVLGGGPNIDQEAIFPFLVGEKTAIQKAIATARRGDVVVIAGKGHENYQILKGGRVHFDDREVAGSAISGC